KLSDIEHIRVFLHYPPVIKGFCSEPIIEILKKYGVRHCFYGHIHGAGTSYAVEGEYEGIIYNLISADYLHFMPAEVY
ncbi:MAG: serine/threonine protein phosphatase, partial [Bacillota bacterium]|nr:serine/threonine protein phosphatase [Bacillota bacterium]